MLGFSAGHRMQEVARDLGKLAMRIPQARNELLEMAVDEVARPRFESNFRTASSAGQPWEELDPQTTARRERAGTGDRPLLATLVGYLAATSRDRWTITREEAAYAGQGWEGAGSYIRFHLGGTDHHPARPWVALDESDMDRLEQVGLSWFDGVVLPGGGFK